MSLFKTVVLVGVIIAVLPSDRENQLALHQTAMSVGAEARSFCSERPNICVSRQDAWESFKSKATFGYELATEMIWGRTSGFPEQRYRSDQIGTYIDSGFGDL
ncbi:MAG: hypothetical protein ACR2O4_14865 [Hyphomicrobiaceae bacterium]